jgi:hypothetical protein
MIKAKAKMSELPQGQALIYLQAGKLNSYDEIIQYKKLRQRKRIF